MREDIAEKILYTLLGGIMVGAIACPMFAISADVVDSARRKNLYKNVDKFKEFVSEKSGLNNFEVENAEIKLGEINGLISFFGTYLKTNGDWGNSYTVLGKCTYIIDKNMAEQIYAKLEESGINRSNIIQTINDVDLWKSKKPLSQAEELLTLMKQAVLNAETKTVSDIGVADEFDRAALKALVYTTPTITTNVSGLFVSSTLNDNGIDLINVSDVYYDAEKNHTFFYVDISKRKEGCNCEGNISESHKDFVKYQVGFDGNLGAAEAYVGFIKGEQSMFRNVLVTSKSNNVNVLDLDL